MDNYYSKYIKYKKKYLDLKGGSTTPVIEKSSFTIGSRVKRIKGADVRHADGSTHPAEAIGKVGTILGIREEEEWPPNSGTILPKAYWVSFDNHYQGTKHEGVRIAVIAEDLVELKATSQVPAASKATSQVPESFNASDYVVTGQYVAGSSSESIWVYDVTISHNGKKIYVIGFTPNQKLGSEFSQLDGYTNPYDKFIDSFKQIAREHAKGKGVKI